MSKLEQIANAFVAGSVQLKEMEFKSGSVGFNASGKVMIDGERYQLSGNIVKIGSKPAGK